jgi:hypothetical protein
MKTTILLGTAALAVLSFLPARAGVATIHGAYATSPGHPTTWVAGATRVHQDLRWDGRHNVLVADVKYSTADWADSDNPTQEDDFILPFPSVRFDPATNKFMANGVVIGTLRDDFIGHKVVLNPGVALSIHRHHGIVHAAIIRQDVADY